MGSWGPKLYQDDVAEDIRDNYKDQLKRGKTNEEVTQGLIQDNEDIISDEDEAPVFWFALADTQWNLGRLLPFVKEKALEYLDNKSNLKRWEEEAINLKEFKARERVLEELEQKLRSPMPPEKKVSQYKLYKCEWKNGDVFAYRLESSYSKEKGLFGLYLLIRKVDECIWWPGHVVPIIYVSITSSSELPKDREDIEKATYIQATFARQKEEFRMLLLATSKRGIPINKLIFIGNFIDIEAPSNEYIIQDKVSMANCKWANFEESIIEKHILYSNK